MESPAESASAVRRCYVIDDDDAIRALLARCARAEGFAVEVMSTAEAAWDLDFDEVSLFLVDWELPGLDGPELCKRIRSRPGGEAPMIFLITARDGEDDIQVGLAAGADDYLVKPVSLDALRLRLRVARARMERRRHQRHRTQRFESAVARLPSTTAAKLVSLSTVAASVAHDINNPLAYVLTNLGHVIEQLPAVAVAEDGFMRARELVQRLEEARTGAERVRRVARDLGLFLRVAEDNEVLVDVHQLLEACVNVAWNEIRHRAELVRRYGQVPVLRAHPSRLGHAFLNVLLNAAQAIDIGHAREHRVEIATSTGEAGEAVIEIHDTGPGIAAKLLPFVFEPLFTTREQSGAAGLGLSIARQIVREHGGEIELESEPEKGTCVRIRLPRADLRQLHSGLVPVRPPKTKRDRARVLIVDDEASVANALRRLIGNEHDVEVVCDAGAAISRICADDVDVVFCDLMMPDVTGMDLYEAVRARLPGAEGKLVFMTGGAFTARAQEFRARVPNVFIDKPFDRDVVLTILDACVDR